MFDDCNSFFKYGFLSTFVGCARQKLRVQERAFAGGELLFRFVAVPRRSAP
jgi:hypothetical protein